MMITNLALTQVNGLLSTLSDLVYYSTSLYVREVQFKVFTKHVKNSIKES